jgi:hypothetical protein
MVKSEAALRREQAIERLVQLQAQKALQLCKTTIVGGEIVRTPPPEPTPGPLAGTGNKLGESDDLPATPGSGRPDLAVARQIKQDIDVACVDLLNQLKAADPRSPFVADVDAILSETAKLLSESPGKFRDPTYRNQKWGRLKVLSECATIHGEVRQHAQAVKATAKLSDGSPEATRLENVCDQAGAEMRTTPDQRAAIKGRAVASMDKVVAFAATRAAIETALGQASTKITKVDSKSVFLRELDLIRQEVAGLIEQGSERLSSPDFQATKIAAIDQLPDCATAYGAIGVRAKQSRDGIKSIWSESPQLDEIADLCEEAVNQMCAQPANHIAINAKILAGFDALDKRAKEGLFKDCLETAGQRFPGPRNTSKVKNMIDYLEGDQAKAGEKSFKGIAAEFAQYVWPALRESSGGAAAQGPRLGTSGLPTRRRGDTAGLETGRALRKAIREASGSKNGGRRLGMRKLFSPGGLSTERGGRTGFYHWHCPGTAQDNMIYSTGHVVYGFTDSHIDSEHVQGQQQAKNIELRDDDSIEIGIDDSGNMFELIDG